MTGDCDPQQCPEGFWDNSEGALGEQRCQRVSTKRGPNKEQPNTVYFYEFILEK